MISEYINLDEYLCQRRDFSLKISTSDIKIEVTPNETDWLVSCYNNKMELTEQHKVPTFKEAFKLFQKLSLNILLTYKNKT